MTGNEYQALAQRTARKGLNVRDKLTNGVIGMCGESGECADLVKKWLYQGHKWGDTREKLIEELGDCLWYCVETATAINIDLENVMERNINKLRARYPAGFDPDKSINREG